MSRLWVKLVFFFNTLFTSFVGLGYSLPWILKQKRQNSSLFPTVFDKAGVSKVKTYQQLPVLLSLDSVPSNQTAALRSPEAVDRPLAQARPPSFFNILAFHTAQLLTGANSTLQKISHELKEKKDAAQTFSLNHTSRRWLNTAIKLQFTRTKNCETHILFNKTR